MKTLYSTLKESLLHNHCPKCFSNKALHLTFKQKYIKTTWFNKRTEDIKSILYCKSCNQQIHPVDWDNDIERVFEYQRKASPQKPAYFKPSKTLWLVIFLVLALVVSSVCFVAFY